MLLEIFVTIPSLVLAEMAWLLRFAVALTCLLVLFAVAVGIIGLRWNSGERRQFATSDV